MPDFGSRSLLSLAQLSENLRSEDPAKIYDGIRSLYGFRSIGSSLNRNLAHHVVELLVDLAASPRGDAFIVESFNDADLLRLHSAHILAKVSDAAVPLFVERLREALEDKDFSRVKRLVFTLDAMSADWRDSDIDVEAEASLAVENRVVLELELERILPYVDGETFDTAAQLIESLSIL